MADFEWEEFKKSIEEAAAEIGAMFEPLTRMLNSQAALGHVMTGDLSAASKVLSGMGTDDVRLLSVTAAALAALSDEELGRRPA